MISQEIMREMQWELEMFLLNKSCDRQLKGFPEDFVFDMMLNIELGTWFNILSEVGIYSEVKKVYDE